MEKKLHYTKIPERSPLLNKEDDKSSPEINTSIIIGSRLFSEEERVKIVVEGQSGQTSIGEICLREKITPEAFYNWSRELITNSSVLGKSEHKEDDKFRIVLEGMNGEFCIAEICKRENITQQEFLTWSHQFLKNISSKSELETSKRNLIFQKRSQIRKQVGEEGLWYFESYLNLAYSKSIIFSVEEDIHHVSETEIEHVICLQKINEIRNINKFFETLNQKLPVGSIFIGCLETFTARKERIWANKIPIFKHLYFGAEFIIKRVLPKLSLTGSFYFDITKGRDRLLSKAEVLGRLVSCGFKIMDYRTIDGLIYFVVQKEKEPSYDLNPSYGPLYAMPRLGKNGKLFKVYKFRTMHPYSEYLQDYLLKTNGYANSGKPADDFRIPGWAKFMRKYWLDELPQLINILKGEMKLVGIRPVSQRYFQDIPKEMQRLRLTQKPGCIPPYVSLNRDGNVMSVLQAEKEYLEAKIAKPYTTDILYFSRAIYNIVFRHKRSA